MYILPRSGEADEAGCELQKICKQTKPRILNRAAVVNTLAAIPVASKAQIHTGPMVFASPPKRQKILLSISRAKLPFQYQRLFGQTTAFGKIAGSPASPANNLFSRQKLILLRDHRQQWHGCRA